MWSSPQTRPPIEKIRKAQWTVENTRVTQGYVDRLVTSEQALRRAGTGDSYVAQAIRAAIYRFKVLDPSVVIPADMAHNQ